MGVGISDFFYKDSKSEKKKLGGGWWWGLREFLNWKIGGGGEGLVNKRFQWHFYSSRRTPVPNYSEIHAHI